MPISLNLGDVEEQEEVEEVFVVMDLPADLAIEVIQKRRPFELKRLEGGNPSLILLDANGSSSSSSVEYPAHLLEDSRTILLFQQHPLPLGSTVPSPAEDADAEAELEGDEEDEPKTPAYRPPSAQPKRPKQEQQHQHQQQQPSSLSYLGKTWKRLQVGYPPDYAALAHQHQQQQQPQSPRQRARKDAITPVSSPAIATPAVTRAAAFAFPSPAPSAVGTSQTPADS